MSAPPLHRLGPEAHDPLGYLNAHFSRTWDIRCHPCAGDQAWTARRRAPAPEGARRYGVADRFEAWTRAPAVWEWLTEQTAAWHRWRNAQQTF